MNASILASEQASPGVVDGGHDADSVGAGSGHHQIPLGRLADPVRLGAQAAGAAAAESDQVEIASVVVFLASEQASYFTGATLDVNGGWFMY